MVTALDAHRTIGAIFRHESPKLVGHIARVVRDVGLAEELAQDALVTALERWPSEGVPQNPGAWLVTTARNRAFDRMRRDRRFDRERDALTAAALDRDSADTRDPETALDEDVGDDLLRLVFIACHPVLSMEGRVALTLRLLGGLTTEEIARAFLVPEPTMAQRIVRAKRTLSEAGIAFEMPGKAERAARLSSVMEVVYLVFNEGYSATAGDDWMRPALTDDARRLGRVLADLVPLEPEVHGLVALMDIQASRMAARTDAEGAPVLLLDQDRTRWDRALITRGLAALAAARALGAERGPFVLQASIAACHARAASAEDTDWSAIASTYAILAEVAPSPVVELNRAVAVGMASGPEAGLALCDRLAREGSLADYHYLPSVRADFLAKLGRDEEARAELGRAASLTRNEQEKKLLRARSERLGR